MDFSNEVVGVFFMKKSERTNNYAVISLFCDAESL